MRDANKLESGTQAQGKSPITDLSDDYCKKTIMKIFPELQETIILKNGLHSRCDMSEGTVIGTTDGQELPV